MYTLFYKFLSINSFIDLESLNLLGGVLFELLLSDFNLAYGLVGNVLLVDLLHRVLKILLRILDIVKRKGIEVGEYFRNDNLLRRIALALACVNYYLTNTVNTLNIGLDLLGINVLAVREDDEVLKSARDIEPAVLIKLTEVACLKEAVLIKYL